MIKCFMQLLLDLVGNRCICMGHGNVLGTFYLLHRLFRFILCQSQLDFFLWQLFVYMYK